MIDPEPSVERAVDQGPLSDVPLVGGPLDGARLLQCGEMTTEYQTSGPFHSDLWIGKREIVQAKGECGVPGRTHTYRRSRQFGFDHDVFLHEKVDEE